MTHQLKTDPEVFDAVASGAKTFEFRRNDRDFQVGDDLILRRTKSTGEQMKAGAQLEYTGSVLAVEVTYILRGPIYGLAEAWVIMGIVKI